MKYNYRRPYANKLFEKLPSNYNGVKFLMQTVVLRCGPTTIQGRKATDVSMFKVNA